MITVFQAIQHLHFTDQFRIAADNQIQYVAIPGRPYHVLCKEVLLYTFVEQFTLNRRHPTRIAHPYLPVYPCVVEITHDNHPFISKFIY